MAGFVLPVVVGAQMQIYPNSGGTQAADWEMRQSAKGRQMC